MRFAIHLLMLVVVALGVGFGLSWYALNDGRFFGGLQDGPWAAWPDVGTAAPNPYTRAYLTRTAKLELGQSEGLAFTATSDSGGAPLSRNCTYRIDGTTPMAAFWTLVALDARGINVADPVGPAAIRSSLLARTDAGAVVLYVGKTLSPRNWLQLAGDGPFTLALTLYDTGTFAGFGSAERMPTITREACS